MVMFLGKVPADDPRHFVHQIPGLDGHPFAVQSPAKGQNLLDDVGPVFDAGLNAVDGLFLLLR